MAHCLLNGQTEEENEIHYDWYPVEMKGSIENDELHKRQRSLQTRRQFERMPEQNTWGVIRVLAAIAITLIVIKVAYAGD